MTASTHRLGGLAAGAVMAGILHTDPIGSGMILAGSMLGCLLPDIDNRRSAISFKWLVVRALVAVGQAVIRGISNLFPKKQQRYIRSLIGHRGLTHSLVPVILVLLAGAFIGRAVDIGAVGYCAAGGVAAGLVSHLLMDMLAGGVPLLLPFTTKRITLAHIKTGGAVEWLFRISLAAIFCCFGIMNIKEIIPWQRLYL